MPLFCGMVYPRVRLNVHIEGKFAQFDVQLYLCGKFPIFPDVYVVFRILFASNGCELIKKDEMKTLETEFAQMLKEHKSAIYTVCYMFSNDSDEVNDLFQEVLINLWKGFGSFRGGCEVRTWIWRVSLNTCISMERRKKKSQTVPLDMEINLFEDDDSDSRQIRMLYDRISKLKPFDRAIVLLWLENLPYEEIGAIVGISVRNVSVRLFRIKEQLKKMSN